jgi:hypothetical protein
MIDKNSELVSKQRFFPQSAFNSLRPEMGSFKTVLLDSHGFKFEENINSNIHININKGDIIRIAHQNNGSLCHVGVPVFEGKNYILVKTGSPSMGSKNFGFSDTVLFVDDQESPDLIMAKESELIFVCIDHDIRIVCTDIDGNEIILSDTESPEFAISSRCFSLSGYGFNIGDVIKYYIEGNANSGGSIIVSKSSSGNSQPWWKLHRAFSGIGGWKIGLNRSLLFNSEIKINNNNRVASYSNNVLTINGFQQPRLLASCGDICEFIAFEKDDILGSVILNQNEDKKIELNSESQTVNFGCDSQFYDPYDPYDIEYFSFNKKTIKYYGSKDRLSGEQILISEKGWNVSDLVSVRSGYSGVVETFNFDEPGYYHICCEDFPNSWMYFHVHVKDIMMKSEKSGGIINKSSIERIKNESINLYFRNDTLYEYVNNFIYIYLNLSSVQGRTSEQIERSIYNHISNQLNQYKIRQNNIACLKFVGFSPMVEHVYPIWKNFKDICDSRGMIGLIDYDSLGYNQLLMFKNLGQVFFVDFSSRLVSGYEKEIFNYIWVVINPSVNGYENTVKELITLGVKNIISDSSTQSSSELVAAISNFISPEFNKNLKFYCARRTLQSEPSYMVPLSKHINGRYGIEPVANTSYGALDLFYKILEKAKLGYSNFFIMPNGVWSFPNANYINWKQIEDFTKEYSDLFDKIKTDFDIEFGLTINIISARENISDFINLCNKLNVTKACLLDASSVLETELYSIQKRFIENNIEIYLEGMPHKVSSGVIGSSYCYGKWLWISEHRGNLPTYLQGIVREI